LKTSEFSKKNRKTRLAVSNIALLVFILSFMFGQVRADLFMNDGSEDIEVVPVTVSAESVVPISGLNRNEEADSFSVGDCFEIEFSNIAAYEDKLPGHYKPILEDPTVCSFTPAATCVKVNPN
jgi:hypothetical protein